MHIYGSFRFTFGFRHTHTHTSLGKFTSKSGRQSTTNIQNMVVHSHVWSSSGVFLLQNSRKMGKIGNIL